MGRLPDSLQTVLCLGPSWQSQALSFHLLLQTLLKLGVQRRREVLLILQRFAALLNALVQRLR